MLFGTPAEICHVAEWLMTMSYWFDGSVLDGVFSLTALVITMAMVF